MTNVGRGRQLFVKIRGAGVIIWKSERVGWENVDPLETTYSKLDMIKGKFKKLIETHGQEGSENVYPMLLALLSHNCIAKYILVFSWWQFKLYCCKMMVTYNCWFNLKVNQWLTSLPLKVSCLCIHLFNLCFGRIYKLFNI